LRAYRFLSFELGGDVLEATLLGAVKLFDDRSSAAGLVPFHFDLDYCTT